jgi:hypothetical protein
VISGILDNLRDESCVGCSSLIVLRLLWMNFRLLNMFCFIDILLVIMGRGFVLGFV